MRKVVIIAVTCLVSCLVFKPALYSAEEEDAGNSSAEYNELGIEKGTEVYGEDISELSEDELKYIPEGWRDGEFESEHPEAEESTSRMQTMTVYPNVNDYISKHNLPPANVQYNHISKLPKINYRYFRPEGVVAHETANNLSTITSEIAFMKRNYQNAFVHAFVDDSNVIEVHPTNFIAWGAGRYANERFIHVELVRVHSYEKFARSVNNYANYIASLLYQYDLGVTRAENPGTGSLWSHRDVTDYLGGTTHTDPHGYFAKWGYDFEQFVDLVHKKYNTMGMKQQKTSKIGQIHASDTRIYADPEDLTKNQVAGEKYINTAFYIKKQATIFKQTYYLISDKPSSKKGTIGWVRKQDMKVYSHTGVDKDKKLMRLKGKGVAYDRVWGGQQRRLSTDLSNMKGDILEVNLTEKVGNNTWYRGYLHGERVWIHEAHLDSVTDVVFNDVPVHSSHFSTIYEMVNRGAIRGYPPENGVHTYRPGKNLSRSHPAVIFTEALHLPIPDDVASVLENFTDLDESHPYAKQIAATYEADIFHGSGGKFMDTPLLREQMATVIAQAFHLEDMGHHSGVELGNVSSSHKKNVELLAQHDISVLRDNFRPREDVSRGQFATFMVKAIHETK